MTCPSGISTTTSNGVCGRSITFTNPNVLDNCGVVNTTQQQGNGSGTFFGVGSSSIVFNATDAAGNWQTCSFSVTVIDNEGPSITCPGNIVVGTDSNQCSANISIPTAAAWDNCGNVALGLQGAPAGSVFAVGSQQLFYSAVAVGGLAVCSFSLCVVACCLSFVSVFFFQILQPNISFL